MFHHQLQCFFLILFFASAHSSILEATDKHCWCPNFQLKLVGMCQKKFLLAQLFCWLVADLLKPNLTILLSLHFTAHWRMSRVLITFCRHASLSKTAEPIKYFHTAYGLLLKGSFNHVISWGPHLEFCIKFGTHAFFITLRHYECNALQTFLFTCHDCIRVNVCSEVVLCVIRY